MAGLVVGYWYQSKGSLSSLPKPQVSVQESSSAGNVVKGGNSLTVDKQEPGELVILRLAVLTEPGFVVIHKSTSAVTPGEFIGHSDYLPAGQHEDVEIEMDNPIKAGEVYFAMLHGDNGDKDYGSESEDKPLKDSKGDVVVQKFEIGKAPSQQED